MSTYLFKEISIDDVRQALQTFIPSSSQTPGRLNFFQLRKCTYLVDFAHNPHGLQLLCDFVVQLDYTQKIGILTGTGDRRDEDIFALGVIAAKYLDEVILRCDRNLRGRSCDEILGLLEQGIRSVNPDLPVSIIPQEDEALIHAYKSCKEGALIVTMCDSVTGTLEKVKTLKEKEEVDQGYPAALSLIP